VHFPIQLRRSELAKIKIAAGGITWTDYALTFAARDIRKVKQIFKTVPPGGQLHKK